MPEKIKKFLNEILHFFYHVIDNEKYLIAIKKTITAIYKLKEDFLLETVQNLLKRNNASDIELPVLVDYFPNNFLAKCGVSLCLYSDMDVAFVLEENNERYLIAIKGSNYFKINLEGQLKGSALNNLKISDNNNLESFLESLIKKGHSNESDSEIYDEFKNLSNLDAGDYMKINENVNMFFFVKDKNVYLLINEMKNENISQNLSKLNLQSFFDKSLENATIQSVFTIPLKKKLILFLTDGFLIQFSYSNYLKSGLKMLENQLVINSTFEKISASFTYDNITYIFSKQNYQFFKPVDNFTKYKRHDKIIGNIFEPCPFNSQPIEELIKPKFRIYKQNINISSYTDQNKDKNKDKIKDQDEVPEKEKNKNEKFEDESLDKTAIKSAALICLLVLVVALIIIIFMNKNFKNSFMKQGSRKEEIEESKRSYKGSATNLSTLFDEAKTFSEKPSEMGFNPKIASKFEPKKNDKGSLVSWDRLSNFKSDISVVKSDMSLIKINLSRIKDVHKSGFKNSEKIDSNVKIKSVSENDLKRRPPKDSSTDISTTKSTSFRNLPSSKLNSRIGDQESIFSLTTLSNIHFKNSKFSSP